MNNGQKPRLLIARAIFPQVIERLQQYFEVEHNQDDVMWTPQQLQQRLQDKLALFATPSEKIDAALLDACPNLRMLGLMAVGFNNVDLSQATKNRVMVSNTPDVLTETTADFGWALMLAAARRVTESEHWLRAGHWQNWRYDSFLGVDLYRSTLGILGMGRIGQAIARRASGFQMQVLYHNRRHLSPEQEQTLNARWVSKEELLKQADHLILMLPYSSATHHTLGAAELALMKPTSVLVNLARGGIVDDVALCAALREGKIAAAGLDVFENEPRLLPDFLSLKNVVLTPHIASASTATRQAMAMCAVDNLVAMVQEGKPRNWVNPFSA
ncbi:MAG: D-glycerate dehydrogenase [Burkholderiales bacterium]|nr:D-glycerate dehydrogenase [Burkholderiales bacterium]